MTDPVELSIYIEASPTTVFPYFTDSDRMCQWMGVAADIDARPGGAYRIDVTGRDVASGTIVEVVPSEKIVFTWGWEGSAGMPPGTSTIEVTLAHEGDGTLVRLRHYDLPDDDAADRHGVGWGHYLPRLAVAAAGGDPGMDAYVSS